MNELEMAIVESITNEVKANPNYYVLINGNSESLLNEVWREHGDCWIYSKNNNLHPMSTIGVRGDDVCIYIFKSDHSPFCFFMLSEYHLSLSDPGLLSTINMILAKAYEEWVNHPWPDLSKKS